LNQYKKEFQLVQYIGIAVDEFVRLARLKGDKVSLLAKYGYTEAMAYDKCVKAGLLSPLYDNGTRGGCWFCMNTRIKDFVRFRRCHAELWDELRGLSKTDNLCSYGFKYGKTFAQVEREMDELEFFQQRQLRLFD
jgi:hypothetical protein